MSTDKPFIISRVFDASRETVWRAWTDVEQMKQWWGPKGAVISYAKMDLKKGGTYLYCMNFMGTEMWGKFVFTEIKKPEKLAFINSFSDKDANITRHPFAETWPLETETVVNFVEKSGKTEVTVNWVPHNASEAEKKTFNEGHASMQQGWTGTFDGFAQYLAGKAKLAS